jgi:SAM-dependent methyltransferase
MFQKVMSWFGRAATLGLAKGPRVSRYYMYRHLPRFAPPPNPQARVLSISHSEALCQLLGFGPGQLTDASYPEVNLLALPYAENTFDAVISDQVLEHIEGSPQRAMEESFRVAKPGALVIHTTCFINPIHRCPRDFWRFTPEALAMLAQPHGTIVEADGWGNPYVWAYILLGLRYQGVPHARWHPFHWLATHNSTDWPLVTWVIARKSAPAVLPAAGTGTRAVAS